MSEQRPIVVGYDGSAQARDALALGAVLAAATGERLVLAGVGEGQDDRLAAGARSLSADLEVECRAVPGRSAAAALQALAESEHPRALVLGSCHRGAVGRVLIGGVAERLLHGAPCPVAIAPRGLAARGPLELKRICVGFDTGSEGWTAIQRGAQIAAAAGAQLRVALVVPPFAGSPALPVLPADIVEQRVTAARTELDRALRSVSRKLEPEPVLLKGDPAQQLAGEAARDVDLLVVGSRGYGPLRSVLLGGVSRALMHSAPCAVMVVPRTAEFDPTGEGLAAADEFVSSG